MPYGPNNLTEQSCRNEPLSVSVPQGVTKQLVLTARDKAGDVVDLYFGGDVGPSRVNLAAVRDWGSSRLLFGLDGVCTDPASGQAIFELTPTQTACPGLHTATFSVFVDDALRHAQPLYLEIEPSDLFASNQPLTMAEVRLFLNDLCPEAHFLLDARQWTDAEVAACIRRPIDRWNGSPPFISNYTVRNFPYRELWLLGATAYMLQIAAEKWRPDRVAVNLPGGGNLEPDEGKSTEYEQVARMRLEEFTQRLTELKVAENAGRAFGTLRSSYGASYL